MNTPISRQTAIVGVGEVGVPEGTRNLNYWGLHAQAAKNAIEDAGLTKADIDGVVVARSGLANIADFPSAFCQYMGITDFWGEQLPIGGIPMTSVIWRAAFGIIGGFANTVLIVVVDNRKSRMEQSGVIHHLPERDMSPEFEYPYGPLMMSNFALAAQRHMYEFGTTNEQLAGVAVAERKWAALHPNAHKRAPLTIEDVLASRMITSPLHLLDCCMVSDGGGAAVMVSADRAVKMEKKPVYVLGFGQCGDSQSVIGMPDLAESITTKKATKQSLDMAGLKISDIDIVYPYDPTTFSVIWALESMGFCKVGEGGRFIRGGDLISPGGDLPTNTHGGLLSYSAPGAPGHFFAVIEAVRQLRGECKRRQVEGAKVAMLHGEGGFAQWGVTVIGK